MPSGSTLDAITQVVFDDVPGPGGANTGFISVSAGATSEIPDGSNGGAFLGGVHMTSGATGTNILSDLGGIPLTGSGFSLPLGPGTYTFNVQQTGPQMNSYSLNFVIGAAAPVPALPPLGLGLLVLGTAGAGLFISRRKKA